MTPRIPKKHANLIIGAYLLLQLGMAARALLPLPPPLHGPWPWRMFDRRGPWERRLEAVGTTETGQRWRVPLEELFRYSRGMTPLRAYDQLEGLADPGQKELHARFARLLADRMAERGVQLKAVELTWIRINIDTGRTQRRAIGTFRVGGAT